MTKVSGTGRWTPKASSIQERRLAPQRMRTPRQVTSARRLERGAIRRAGDAASGTRKGNGNATAGGHANNQQACQWKQRGQHD